MSLRIYYQIAPWTEALPRLSGETSEVRRCCGYGQFHAIMIPNLTHTINRGHREYLTACTCPQQKVSYYTLHRVTTTFHNMEPLPPLDPPSRNGPQMSPVIMFRHPAYPRDLLRLSPVDGPQHDGVDYDCALISCGIVTGNTWATGWLATMGVDSQFVRVERPADGILREQKYYYFIGDHEPSCMSSLASIFECLSSLVVQTCIPSSLHFTTGVSHTTRFQTFGRTLK